MSSTHANSAAAYASIEDLGDRQREVLACVRQRGGPMTDRAIAEAIGREVVVTRPRVSELIAAGHLREVGNTQDHLTGRRVRAVDIPR